VNYKDFLIGKSQLTGDCGAVLNGRRGLGIELKPSYYRQAVRNLATIQRNDTGLLFGQGDDT